MEESEGMKFTRECGERTIKQAKELPFCRVKWCLSKTHDVKDICDEYAAGGKNHNGVYEPDEVPPYPPHEGCKCCLAPVPLDSNALIKRLKEWQKNPESHPDIEKWYQNNKDKLK